MGGGEHMEIAKVDDFLGNFGYEAEDKGLKLKEMCGEVKLFLRWGCLSLFKCFGDVMRGNS